jgi:DNA topoisomerase I
MSQTLIIVESPSKAHTIQSYLPSTYKVVACKGHITDLAKGGIFGLGIDIEHDFRPRYVFIQDQLATVQMLMDEVKEADKVLLSSDFDREGEAIAWHLQQRLGDIGKPMKRITMHEITKKGVAEALKNPHDIDMKLVRSQEARRILDRLVGFMASPFLMRYFGGNLSAGRVQSVVVRMISDREQEIKDFKPEEYWVIQTALKNAADAQFIAKLDRKVSDGETAAKIKSELIRSSTQFIISDIEASEEKKKAPPPLITAKLQQVMSKDYGISSDRTMKAAQSLYERSFITYMRTDSVRANPDAIKDVRQWIKDSGYAVPKIANVFKNKDAAQDAHECIRPTDLSVKADQFSGDEEAVYDVIRKHFIASQMTPAIYSTLKVMIEATDKEKPNDFKHLLKANGKAIKDKGWLAMFEVNAGKIDIPNLSKDEQMFLVSATAEQKFTQPPPRYSEAHLIETLDKKSIGRPSTFAEIVSKITARGYVERDGSVFRPTELGKQITDELTKYFSFMNTDYTAKMELQLDEIATGKTDHVKMLRDFFTPFQEELNKAYVGHGAELCEECGSPMIERQAKKTGDRFLGCTRFPSCYSSKPITTDNRKTA